MLRKAVVVFAMLAGLSLLASPAFASSGEISRAYTDPNWTRGDIAGSVTWDSCAPGQHCAWIPYATIQPTLEEYRCTSNGLMESGKNIFWAWNGGGQTKNGTASFVKPDSLILTGVHGQRICLFVIETRKERSEICMRQYEVLGLDPMDCPIETAYRQHYMATRLFELAPTPQPEPAAPQQPASGPDAPPQPASNLPAKKPRLTKAIATRRVKARLGRQFRGKWRRGKARAVKCRVVRVDLSRCSISWKFSSKRFAGRATVRPKSTIVQVRSKRIRKPRR